MILQFSKAQKTCQIVQSVPEKLGTGRIVDLNFPLYIRLLQLHSSSSTQLNQVNTTQTPESTSVCLSPTRTIRDKTALQILVPTSLGFLLDSLPFMQDEVKSFSSSATLIKGNTTSGASLREGIMPNHQVLITTS